MGKQIGQFVNSATSATRSRDPTCESLQPFQSARVEYDLRAPFSEHERRGLAYSAVCSACRPWRPKAFGAYASDEPAAR